MQSSLPHLKAPERATSVGEEMRSAAPPSFKVLLSTVGLGLIPNAHQANVKDRATEACCKALQDALERGSLLFLSNATDQVAQLRWSVHLGVPAGSCEAVNRDVVRAHLGTWMQQQDQQEPRRVQLSVTLGGLWATSPSVNPEDTVASRGMLAVVASVCVEQDVGPQERPHAESQAVSTTSVTAATVEPPHPPLPTIHQHHDQTIASSSTTAAALLMAQQQAHEYVKQQQRSHEPMHLSSTTAADAELEQTKLTTAPVSPQNSQPSAASAAVTPNGGLSASIVPSRQASSMDVLAHVSAEICDQQQQREEPALARNTQTTQPQSMVLDAAEAQAPGSDVMQQDLRPTDESTTTPGLAESPNSNPNTNYKKLPPGKTPKNNKRLFVKHRYQDYSKEVMPEQEETGNGKTMNAAFPIKLHETLSEIERDGHDDIIGWMPHGRSFKIHKQDEFVQLVLPKYFIMTKKSSFLRQLNLYGFNRLSGVGPDQASYYHEKFLRGMKFLCRRMQRCKVNGNRIRAAGNPDQEPILSNFPPCGQPIPAAERADGKAKEAVSLSAEEPPSPQQQQQQQHVLGQQQAQLPLATTAAVLQQLMAQQQQQQNAAAVLAASPPLTATNSANAAAAAQAALSSLLVRSGSSNSVGLLAAAAAAAATPASALHAALSQRALQQQLESQDHQQLGHAGTGVTSASADEDPNNEDKINSNTSRRSPSMSSSSSLSNNGNGNNISFPIKLQRILDKLESEGNNTIISWLPHGRAFMVYNPDRFVKEIMPMYFHNQTKYSSFQRQLHMYNFQRVAGQSSSKGAYYHPQFQRGQPALCQALQRSSPRSGSKGSLQRHASPALPAEPDFEALPPLPRIPPKSAGDAGNSGIAQPPCPQVVVFDKSAPAPAGLPLNPQQQQHLSASLQHLHTQHQFSTGALAQSAALAVPSVSSSSAFTGESEDEEH